MHVKLEHFCTVIYERLLKLVDLASLRFQISPTSASGGKLGGLQELWVNPHYDDLLLEDGSKSQCAHAQADTPCITTESHLLTRERIVLCM
jgi:hypothetical protein